MSETTAVSVKTRRIWEGFTQGGNADLDAIAPVIRDSWLRSRQLGLDALMGEAPLVLAANQLNKRLEQSRLYRAAGAPVRLMTTALAGRNILVLLIDGDGVLLEVVGETKAMQKATEVGIVPGCNMSEDAIGTDAISCCLALRKPINVAFCEHYIQIGHIWAGSAAPVHTPSANELVGCLSIYGHGDAAHPEALEFVTSSAEMVERELIRDETRARLILRENYDYQRIKFPNNELLCISRDGIAFGGSPAAMTLLGLSHAVSGDFNGFLRVLDVPGTGFDLHSEPREIQIQTKIGDALKTELLPVVHERELVGFVGVLPSRKIEGRFHIGGRRQNTNGPWHASYTFHDIVHGESGLIDCISQAEKIANENWPVLITGESGTGKELFAHAVHNGSRRKTGPFVAVNCGALTDELLAAEMFGYTDGAFTGAARGGRRGKIELANGGTIFLDEAEAMSPRMQVQMLRVLEEGRVLPVGGENPRTIDVRVIAATNVDLEEKIREGSFRRDLYYRLSVLSIFVPPLRERPNDIPALVRHFFTGLGGIELDADAMERLKAYFWPGNVRELRNVLQQAATRATGGIIRSKDLPPKLIYADQHEDPHGGVSRVGQFAESDCAPSLREAERDVILRCLRECNGNISKAADILGIHRVTLHRKLDALGIKSDRSFK